MSLHKGAGPLLAATLLTLTACGAGSTSASAGASHSPTKSPVPRPWVAASVCPQVHEGLEGTWAIAPDNNGRGCIIVGTGAQNRNINVLLNLRARPDVGTCGKVAASSGVRLRQTQGLGATACLAEFATGPTSPGAAVEIGITFPDHAAIDVACGDRSNTDVARVTATCRMIAESTIRVLGEG